MIVFLFERFLWVLFCAVFLYESTSFYFVFLSPPLSPLSGSFFVHFVWHKFFVILRANCYEFDFNVISFAIWMHQSNANANIRSRSKLVHLYLTSCANCNHKNIKINLNGIFAAVAVSSFPSPLLLSAVLLQLPSLSQTYG